MSILKKEIRESRKKEQDINVLRDEVKKVRNKILEELKSTLSNTVSSMVLNLVIPLF